MALIRRLVADGVPQRQLAKGREYGIEVRRSTDLASVDGDARTVTLERGEVRETLAYDLLHVEPPQGPSP
ncbi:hypothetical protein [Microbacterium jiangjiandongii]|uniref:hypothetical protein n=1 Tax=Microbacterium jiangjiandongii TaxID=3049071 RepID=UPI00214CA303|nr:hypothetical protein [Microbacterium sp. zg.Y843]MCR2815009.1 hypothetical protein [Microbacterium sp. zg.Y843]